MANQCARHDIISCSDITHLLSDSSPVLLSGLKYDHPFKIINLVTALPYLSGSRKAGFSNINFTQCEKKLNKNHNLTAHQHIVLDG